MGMTLEFVKFLVGRRSVTTSDTQAELDHLKKVATGKQCIIEVGVHEGAASKYLCEGMDKKARLYLIDPYFRGSRLERLFNISFTQKIAALNIKKWKSQIEFMQTTSVEAANRIKLSQLADLIFIDALHDYQSALEDFRCWSPKLASHGLLAFHDSHVCEASPDVTEERFGSVRLVNEIIQHQHGNWKVVSVVDTLTVFIRNPG